MTAQGPFLLRSLAGKTLWDQRRTLIGWVIAFAAIAFIISSFWPTLRDQAEDMQKLLDSYPEAFKAFFNADDLTTAEGFLRGELFSAMLPIMFLVYAIGRGADLIAGEEERGALDVLVVQPLTRRRIVLEKSLALTIGLGILALGLFLALAVGSLTFGLGINLANAAAASFLLALFSLGMGMIAFTLGALRGRKGLAVGVASAVAATAYLVNGLAKLVEWVDNIRWLSPFAYYESSDPLKEGLDPVNTLVLVALPLALLGIALWAFPRRDIGV